jgi:transcriptional regulator of arginine metabolism
MSSNKTVRQAKIKEIISNQEVGSQEDLENILKSYNFETTQATLSRDLHEIGIVRIPAKSGFKYVFHEVAMQQSLQPMMGREIISNTRAASI